MIRGLWDKGEASRLGNDHAPAFGCVMVGNSTFPGKGGNLRTVGYEPLLSRLTHHIRLPRPGKAEISNFAAVLFPESEGLRSILAIFGLESGNIRAMATAARSAERIGGGSITPSNLRTVVKMMGG